MYYFHLISVRNQESSDIIPNIFIDKDIIGASFYTRAGARHKGEHTPPLNRVYHDDAHRVFLPTILKYS